jgi:type I restriction enzyme M protein
MAKKLNERLTEKLFEKLLDNQGITETNGWKIEYQKSDNPKLYFTSKTGKSGEGSPDFIITRRGCSNFVIIVEAKASTEKLEKIAKGKISQAQTNINPYAVNGALHYAKCKNEEKGTDINRDFNTLFIGCAGENEDEFTYKTYFLKQGEEDYVEVLNHSLSDINKDFKNTMIEIAQLYNQIPEETTKPKTKKKVETKTEIQISDDDAKNLAQDIHELLRDQAGVPANQKPILISAILLACDNPNFKMDNNVLSFSYKDGSKNITVDSVDKGTNKTEGLTKGEIIVKAALSQAQNTGMNPFKLAKLESSFKFIETHSALNNDKEICGEIQSALNMLCEIILGESVYKLPQNKKANLYKLIKQNSINDILGHFYSEFLSYGGGDGKDLGIVLTPSHITSLMVDLVGFTLNDRMYDCCTGTAGFLVAGISKAFNEVKNNPKITNKEEVLENLRASAFIGCEVEDHMFTIAATNMILRGDGKSNLFIDSCFNVAEDVKILQPTCAVLNPPYSLKDANLAELKFIEHSLGVIKEGGLCAAIVPKSIFLDKNKKLRVQILQKHSLVAVITPPKDLFLEVAGTETAIGIFKSGTPHNPKVKTWLCQFDDGYDMIPKQGRIDKRGFKRLSAELVERFTNREVIPGYSNLVSIEPEMECLYDCWEDTNKAVDVDFKNKLKDSVVFDVKRNIEEYLKTGKYINHLKDFDLIKQELNLDSVEWGEFVVGDLFNFTSNKQLEKRNYIEGNMPFITATTFNNGISTYIGNEMNVVNNAITITIDGECGITFYHDYNFIPGSSTVALTLKDRQFNKHIAIFMCTCLEKLKTKYSYGLKLQKSRLKVEKIHLPVKNGEPDYEFMERYIKSLNFSEILE